MKCDRKGCLVEAFLRINYPMIDVHIHICPTHYEELKRETRGLEGCVIEEIHDPTSPTQP